jgi:ATP synthase protein I
VKSAQDVATLVWLLRTQVLMVCGVALVTGLLAGADQGVSVLAGGLVAFLPNVYFAIRFVRPLAGGTPRQILNRFYAGEAIKLALTAVLFFCVLQIPAVKPLPLMAGFMTALSAFWLALLKR